VYCELRGDHYRVFPQSALVIGCAARSEVKVSPWPNRLLSSRDAPCPRKREDFGRSPILRQFHRSARKAACVNHAGGFLVLSNETKPGILYSVKHHSQSVEFMADLPKSALGKVLHRKLLEEQT